MRARRMVESGKPDHVVGYMIFCPACKCGHAFYTDHPDKPKWGFNGDQERPTFTPSMLIRGHLGPDNYGVCHSFVRDGKIEFLSDCTHALRGQTVELPEN